MTSAQQIEITLRAANVAKSILDMPGTSTIYVARMQFVQTLKLLKELDECLEKIEGKIPSPPKR